MKRGECRTIISLLPVDSTCRQKKTFKVERQLFSVSHLEYIAHRREMLTQDIHKICRLLKDFEMLPKLNI